MQHKLKCLVTDNGELASNNMRSFCAEKGILHLFTAPYTSAHNGRAERLHRTLMDKARAMRISCTAPPDLWDEFCATAAYLTNLTGTSANDGKTPYALWHNKLPSITHLREIGCRAFALIPTSNPKILHRSLPCILIGYAPNSKAYRLWDPTTNHVFNSFHVSFIERRELPPPPPTHTPHTHTPQDTTTSSPQSSQETTTQSPVSPQDHSTPRPSETPSTTPSSSIPHPFSTVSDSDPSFTHSTFIPFNTASSSTIHNLPHTPGAPTVHTSLPTSSEPCLNSSENLPSQQQTASDELVTSNTVHSLTSQQQTVSRQPTNNTVINQEHTHQNHHEENTVTLVPLKTPSLNLRLLPHNLKNS